MLLASIKRALSIIAGIPLKGVKVKIVKTDDQTIQLPVNQVGALMVQPANIPRYLNYEKEVGTTMDISTDGWYSSGDIGCIDDRGHLLVQGKKILRIRMIHVDHRCSPWE